MLGKTAGGLFWMSRYLERSENIARMVETGFRMALTRGGDTASEWASVVDATGGRQQFLASYDDFDAASVVDFLLRDTANPASVLASAEGARMNARLVRTALTREVWEAVNEMWMALKTDLARPVRDRDLPETLDLVRRRNEQVRGAMHGSMLRNDVFDFARIGTFLERADNTARLLDVKYYVLLPSVSQIGSSLDNVQWETVLRAVAGQRAYSWLTGGEITPKGIADFLILDGRMPRSLAFCVKKLVGNLGYLERQYGLRHSCHDRVAELNALISGNTIDRIFENGLHEFIIDVLRLSSALGADIERDYRFYD